MRVFVLILAIYHATSWAILEPEEDDRDTEAHHCISCMSPKAPVHLTTSDLKLSPKCGKKCEELLAAAKAEGMRCPHEWADFQLRKHGLRRGSDACEFYRKMGKDPTQWSKGLCATALYNDFQKVGIPIVAQAEAHSWASMLNDPKFHMVKLDITDPALAPRGAVLVYETDKPKPKGRKRGKVIDYGHIEMAMGDEFCSDYCYPVNFLVKAPGERGKLLGAYMPGDG